MYTVVRKPGHAVYFLPYCCQNNAPFSFSPSETYAFNAPSVMYHILGQFLQYDTSLDPQNSSLIS
jgi:hypothetical protein